MTSEQLNDAFNRGFMANIKSATSPGMTAAIGALIGASAGGAYGGLSPLDKSKKDTRLKKVLRALIVGGTLGGAGGYGINKLTAPRIPEELQPILDKLNKEPLIAADSRSSQPVDDLTAAAGAVGRRLDKIEKGEAGPVTFDEIGTGLKKYFGNTNNK